MTARFVAYFRVSTARQGVSGLGLEGQQKAVSDYLKSSVCHHELVGEFIEVESGKRNDRPELLKAIELCRKLKAKLIIAKLDRLARNVHFVSGLMESKVEFVAVDFPDANRLSVHILAAVAEHEAAMISQRTKTALSAAKARGTKLGWAIPARQAGHAEATLRGNSANREAADQFAARVLPVIESVRASGITSLKAVAAELNARGIKTARGGSWYPTTVSNLLERTGA